MEKKVKEIVEIKPVEAIYVQTIQREEWLYFDGAWFRHSPLDT